MVKRGLLEDPFTRRPEAGPLQPLPSYMVDLFGCIYTVRLKKKTVNATVKCQEIARLKDCSVYVVAVGHVLSSTATMLVVFRKSWE